MANISDYGRAKLYLQTQLHYDIENIAEGGGQARDVVVELVKRIKDLQEVPSPETWKDITDNGVILEDGQSIIAGGRIIVSTDRPGYRLRKVQVMNAAGNTEWAFKVEKREP